MSKTDQEWVLTSMRMPRKMNLRMKNACKSLGMTQTAFIRRAIEGALNRVEAEGLPPVPKLGCDGSRSGDKGS